MSEEQTPVEQDTEPHATDRPERDDQLSLRRDVEVPDMMMFLRIMLGFRPEQQVPGEQAALEGQPSLPPATRVNIDCGRWLAWARAGLPLFTSETLPPLRLVVTEAKRVMLALAKEHHGGNITMMAETLGSSRRSIRENLRATGLYAQSTQAEGEPNDGLD